jgi:hypothetical protein
MFTDLETVRFPCPILYNIKAKMTATETEVWRKIDE